MLKKRRKIPSGCLFGTIQQLKKGIIIKLI